MSDEDINRICEKVDDPVCYCGHLRSDHSFQGKDGYSHFSALMYPPYTVMPGCNVDGCECWGFTPLAFHLSKKSG